jgi:hypothetical protein
MKQGAYGRNITTQMREDLSWQAIYILDFFEGIWRKPGAKVSVSNGWLAEAFGFSSRTVQRAIKELDDHGYITRRIIQRYVREIYPGGSVMVGTSENAVRCDGSGALDDKNRGGVRQECHGGTTEMAGGYDRGGENKTLKDKTPELKNIPESTGDSVKLPSTLGEVPEVPDIEPEAPPTTDPPPPGWKADARKFCEHTWMTEGEAQKLITKYGKDEVRAKLAEFDEKLGTIIRMPPNQRTAAQKEYLYRDHYRTIANWIRRDVAKREPTKSPPGRPKKVRTAAGWVEV